MKTTPLSLLGLCLLLMFAACETEEAWHGTRRIVNETQSAIQLEVRAQSQWYRYEIPPQEELLLNGLCYCCNPAPEGCELGWPPFPDSANLMFDSTRILAFGSWNTYPCETRNFSADPAFECYGYEAMEITKDSIVYTYRITDQDYQNAQPIVE